MAQDLFMNKSHFIQYMYHLSRSLLLSSTLTFEIHKFRRKSALFLYLALNLQKTLVGYNCSWDCQHCVPWWAGFWLLKNSILKCMLVNKHLLTLLPSDRQPLTYKTRHSENNSTIGWPRSENANSGWPRPFQIVVHFMVHCIMPANFRL